MRQGKKRTPSGGNSVTCYTWDRPLAITAAVLFVISSAFPAVAGLSKNTAAFPKWDATPFRISVFFFIFSFVLRRQKWTTKPSERRVQLAVWPELRRPA